jgi:hypothetical protein
MATSSPARRGYAFGHRTESGAFDVTDSNFKQPSAKRLKSPRPALASLLRGEVEIRVSEFRVRGSLQEHGT